MNDAQMPSRPPWCPHSDCAFLSQSQDAVCVGRLPEPRTHGIHGVNTHRWCMRGAPDDEAWIQTLEVHSGDAWATRRVLKAVIDDTHTDRRERVTYIDEHGMACPGNPPPEKGDIAGTWQCGHSVSYGDTSCPYCLIAELQQHIATLETATHAEANEAALTAFAARCERLQGRVKKLEAERDAAVAERDRLREAIEKAPHDSECASLLPDLPGNIRECNCWKRTALGAVEVNS